VKRALLLGALLLGAASCRSVAPALAPLPPDDPQPARLLEAWAGMAQSRHALRGRAKLAVDDAEGKVHLRGRQLLIVERPARLRVEVQGLLDQTVAVLVTDGDRYELFRADDRSYQSGLLPPGLLREQAMLDLTPQEAIDVLLGAPAPDTSLTPRASLRARDGGVVLELAGPDGALRRRAHFDAKERLTQLEVFGAGGALAWRASFDDFRPIGGIDFAHVVVLETSAPHTRAEIALRDVELNPKLPDGVFRLRGGFSAPERGGS
jgi:hypothetical protein